MVLPWARGQYMPDFLTPKPPPASDGWALTSQLDHISSTSPECLDMQLQFMQQHTPLAAALRRSADSGKLASVVAAGLQRFWTDVLAEMWPSLQRSIRQDVVRQTALMAVGGTGTVLNGLHRTLRWSDGTMHIDKPYRETIDFRNGELVLVPSVLEYSGWPRSSGIRTTPCSPTRPRRPTSRSARQPRTPRYWAPVAPPRVRCTPSSTTELRGMLGLSASTISITCRCWPTPASPRPRGRAGSSCISRQPAEVPCSVIAGVQVAPPPAQRRAAPRSQQTAADGPGADLSQVGRRSSG
jgi:hypothetical protein